MQTKFQSGGIKITKSKINNQPKYRNEQNMVKKKGGRPKITPLSLTTTFWRENGADTKK